MARLAGDIDGALHESTWSHFPCAIPLRPPTDTNGMGRTPGPACAAHTLRPANPNPTAQAENPDLAAPAAHTDLPAWDRWFELTRRGSTLGTEFRGGLVTFFTMAYTVVLNPLIIGTAADINSNYIGGGDKPVVAIGLVAGVTALVAGLLTITMGAIGRFPLAIAAALGLNSFLAYTIAPLMT